MRCIGVVAGVVLSLSLAACDGGASGDDLGAALVSNVPGYTVSSGDSGAIDRTTAAASLPTAPQQTGASLDAAGFRAGYSRVFRRSGQAGGDYVLLTVYDMTSSGSAGFVAAERNALIATGTVQLFSVDTIPESTGFVLSGPTHRGDRDVFCDGVIFPHADRVFAVTTCSAAPIDAQRAIAIAQQQAARAAAR